MLAKLTSGDPAAKPVLPSIVLWVMRTVSLVASPESMTVSVLLPA
jgi:hypothetical protein